MAKQLVDTTTNNGTHIGDPAKTAFEKVNANFNELYPAALPETEPERAAARTRLGANSAANLTTGTLPDERVSETLPASKAYRQGNILGTVSQSGGVPTGAIIERGSNANGQYIRFADGTQICTGTAEVTAAINLAYSGGFRSEPQSYQYPASFAEIPLVYFFPMFANSTTGAWDAMYTGGSKVQCLIGWRAHVSGASMVCRGHLLAIGRWY